MFSLQNYDVAIIALKNRVNLPSVVLPAIGSTATYAGSRATILGWGTTSSGKSASSFGSLHYAQSSLMSQGGSISYDLRQATVTVWNNTLCGTRYGTGTNGINTVKLCAAAPGRDTCQVFEVAHDVTSNFT